MNDPRVCNLIEALHDECLSQGQILSDEGVAFVVMRYENDEVAVFSSTAILFAVRQAGELFVESMQENCMDTPISEHFTLQDQAIMLESYQRMRPSVVRRKELLHILGGGK